MSLTFQEGYKNRRNIAEILNQAVIDGYKTLPYSPARTIQASNRRKAGGGQGLMPGVSSPRNSQRIFFHVDLGYRGLIAAS